jgi:hypothetical protein
VRDPARVLQLNAADVTMKLSDPMQRDVRMDRDEKLVGIVSLVHLVRGRGNAPAVTHLLEDVHGSTAA